MTASPVIENAANKTLESRSCFNCRLLKTWNYSATLEEPQDSGWECGNQENQHWLSPEEEQEAENQGEKEFAQAIAKSCPLYSFLDWDNQERLNAQADAAEEAADFFEYDQSLLRFDFPQEQQEPQEYVF